MESITEALEKIANQLEDSFNTITSLMEEGKKGSDGSGTHGLGDTFEDDGLHFVEHEPSPLNGMAEGVIKDAMKKHVGPQNISEHIAAFRSAITWSEPFIIGLLCFHIVIMIMAVKMSRSPNFGLRVTFLLFLGALIRSVDRLNDYGRENWDRFATQDYFDKSGIFATIMFSAPLLLTCFLMMLSYAREATRLMVELKKLKLKNQMRKQKNAKSSAKKSN